MDTKEQLLNNILSIVDQLEGNVDVDDEGTQMSELGYTWNDIAYEWQDENGAQVDAHSMNGYDFLSSALDIEYRVSARGDYLGAEVLVTSGGPNIWVDTKRDQVVGAWGSDRIERGYTDNIGLDEACEENYNAMKG